MSTAPPPPPPPQAEKLNPPPTALERVRLKPDDRQAALDCCNEKGATLKFTSEKMKNDREVVLVAVTQNGLALSHASVRLRHHREIVKTAVCNSGLALQAASTELRGDREIALAAARQTVAALEFASSDLKNDPDFMLEAVLQNTEALAYGSEKVKGTPKVVRAAVIKRGTALAHASPALKKDLQIVSAAVLECEAPGDPEYPLFTALNWASDGIRNDKDFVSTAIAKNPFCYAGASEALRGDPEIILLAAGAKPELLSSFQGYGERLDWPIPQSAIARGKIHDWVTEQLTTRSKFVDVFLLGTRGPDGRSSSAVGLASRIRTVQKAKVGGGGGKTSAQVRDLLALVEELAASNEKIRAARDGALRAARPGEMLAQILPPSDCLLPCIGGPAFDAVRQRIAAFAGAPSGVRLKLLRGLSGSLFRLDFETPGWTEEERVAEPPTNLGGLGGLIRNSNFFSCMAGRLLGSPGPTPAPTRTSSSTKVIIDAEGHIDAAASDPAPYVREPVTPVAVVQPRQPEPQRQQQQQQQQSTAEESEFHDAEEGQ